MTPHDEDGVYFPGPWAADGSGFYLLTDEGREFQGSRSTTSKQVASNGWRLPEADVEEWPSQETVACSPGSSTRTAGLS